MANNLYEAMMTKNGVLARFFDECHGAAKMVMKVVKLISQIAIEHHVSADDITYEVFCPRGGDVIVIRLKHPTKTLST